MAPLDTTTIDASSPSSAISEIKIHLQQMKDDIHELRNGLRDQDEAAVQDKKELHDKIGVFSEDVNKAKGAFRTVTTVSIILQGFAAAVISGMAVIFCTVIYPSITNGITDHVQRQVEESVSQELSALKVATGVNSALLSAAGQVHTDVDTLKTQMAEGASAREQSATKLAEISAQTEQNTNSILSLKQQFESVGKLKSDMQQAQIDIVDLKSSKPKR